MTAHKKHRRHESHDRANVETRYIEKPFREVTKFVDPSKKLKNNGIPHAKPRIRDISYEFSPSIERSKGVGAKQQRAIPQKIARQQRNRTH